MTGIEIIKKVKSLGLPKGSFVVFGSCPMALAGIRKSNDIDMLVTKKVFYDLQKSGWPKSHKDIYDNPLTKDVFEIHHK